MTKQTTLRLPDDLAAQAEVVASVKNISVNQLAIDALQIEIMRLKDDDKFMVDLRAHSKKHKELLDRLAK
jgi:exosome complex RNA-binding protein Csl4